GGARSATKCDDANRKALGEERTRGLDRGALRYLARCGHRHARGAHRRDGGRGDPRRGLRPTLARRTANGEKPLVLGLSVPVAGQTINVSLAAPATLLRDARVAPV